MMGVRDAPAIMAGLEKWNGLTWGGIHMGTDCQADDSTPIFRQLSE
jgi:hypothetical protein